MNPRPGPMLDESTLDALLAAPAAELHSLPDGGFTRTVLARLRAEQAQERVEPRTVDAHQALDRLGRRAARAQRAAHWSLAGCAVGALGALLVALGGAPPPALEPGAAVALSLALTLAALALAAPGDARER